MGRNSDETVESSREDGFEDNRLEWAAPRLFKLNGSPQASVAGGKVIVCPGGAEVDHVALSCAGHFAIDVPGFGNPFGDLASSFAFGSPSDSTESNGRAVVGNVAS